MEIKHSSPNVARPVEVHAGKRRWPWIVLIVVGVLVVLGGIVAALYFYGGTLLNKKSAQDNQTNEQNQTNQTGQTNGTQATGEFTVKPEPDTDELTQLVVGRFAGPDPEIGEVTLSTADATDSGDLKETKVLTHTPKIEDAITQVHMSPNGQFAVIFEGEVPKTGGDSSTPPPAQVKQVLSLVELSTGKETTIANVDDKNPGYFGPVIWTPNSEHVIFDITDQGGAPASLNTYTVATGITAKAETSLANNDRELFLPMKATENDLFVIKTTVGGEDPGQLGTLSLSDKGEVGGDFEKIIDMSAAGRGFDVSSDGKDIVIARGTGTSLGSSNDGPFYLELLDRSTGEIQELRKSATEAYNAPLFSRDGETIVYGAASGVWMLEIKSDDRTQLVESSEFKNLVTETGSTAEPRFFSPNGEIVVVATLVEGGVYEFHTLNTGTKEAVLDEIGHVEPIASDEKGSLSVYGWTI